MINLHNKTFVCFGLRGSGKSTLLHHIGSSFGRKCLCYDTLGEVPPTAKYDSYTPYNKTYNTVELEVVIKAIVESRMYRLLLIDEANRYCPPKPIPLPPAVADLNDQCRHYNMGVGFIARRPVQLNQDLTELSDYMFIFHLKGKNDIKALENLSEGLGQAVLKCPQYHFILVYPDRSFKLMSPITPDKQWLSRAKSLISGKKLPPSSEK